MKSVIFDLDGTLLDRDASVEQFINAQYGRLADHLSHIPKIDYVTRFIKLDDHGYVWKDKVYQTLVTEFEIEGMSWQALLDDYETQFQFHCVPFRFLFEMLNVFKKTRLLVGNHNEWVRAVSRSGD